MLNHPILVINPQFRFIHIFLSYKHRQIKKKRQCHMQKRVLYNLLWLNFAEFQLLLQSYWLTVSRFDCEVLFLKGREIVD